MKTISHRRALVMLLATVVMAGTSAMSAHSLTGSALDVACRFMPFLCKNTSQERSDAPPASQPTQNDVMHFRGFWPAGTYKAPDGSTERDADTLQGMGPRPSAPAQLDTPSASPPSLPQAPTLSGRSDESNNDGINTNGERGGADESCSVPACGDGICERESAEPTEGSFYCPEDCATRVAPSDEEPTDGDDNGDQRKCRIFECPAPPRGMHYESPEMIGGCPRGCGRLARDVSKDGDDEGIEQENGGTQHSGTQSPEERAAMNTRQRRPGVCMGATSWYGGGIGVDGNGNWINAIFMADYDNLVNDVNDEGGLFLYDRASGTTKRIAVFAHDARMTADGKYVQYLGTLPYSPNLNQTCAGYTGTCGWSKMGESFGFYEYDVQAGVSTLNPQEIHGPRLNFAAHGMFGSPKDDISCRSYRATENGKYALCETYAALATEDLNKRMDVYVIELENSSTPVLISRKNAEMIGVCSWDDGEPSGTHNGEPIDGTPPPYKPHCGDGWLDQGEMCDDGPKGSDTCSAYCLIRK